MTQDKIGEFELNKIYCIDCLEGLKKIPDSSIDLVLTDPPYNIDFSKYDSVVDESGRHFHNTKDLGWNKFDLKRWGEDSFKEFDRIIKNTGSILIFAPQWWGYVFYEPAIKNGFKFKCEIIWEKSNPIPNLRRKNYRSCYEQLLWFSRFDKNKPCHFTFNFTKQGDMKNYFKSPILQGSERVSHPTQKPLRMLRRFLGIHSNRGDLVLDCFMGSGSTAVACKQLGRKFIGFEINPEYVKIANKRLQQEVLLDAPQNKPLNSLDEDEKERSLVSNVGKRDNLGESRKGDDGK